MVFSGYPQFNIDDLTDLNEDGSCNYLYNFGFDGSNPDPLNVAGPSQPSTATDIWGNWDSNFDRSEFDPSNIASPSQPYTGVEVWGGPGEYPDFPGPNSAPISLYPANEVVPDEGYISLPYQRVATPSPAVAHSLIQTLSWGAHYLPAESHGAPVSPTWTVPNPDDLNFDFSAAAGGSYHYHPPPVYSLPYEESWPRLPQSDLPDLDAATGVAPPELPTPVPIASSSGPERTRQPARRARRQNPMKPAKKVKPRENKEGWDKTLARFREIFDAQYTVQNGQPSGGLVPETAIAETNKFAKEDLKRSPLQGTAAGEGKRVRNLEDYFKYLLRVIRPTPVLEGGRFHEIDTTVAVLSRIAGELEGKLADINGQQPSLCRYTDGSKAGKHNDRKGRGKVERGVKKADEGEGDCRAKKNKGAEDRREREWDQLERIARLFRAPQPGWTRTDVLTLAILCLLYGPTAFGAGEIQVRPGL